VTALALLALTALLALVVLALLALTALLALVVLALVVLALLALAALLFLALAALLLSRSPAPMPCHLSSSPMGRLGRCGARFCRCDRFPNHVSVRPLRGMRRGMRRETRTEAWTTGPAQQSREEATDPSWEEAARSGDEATLSDHHWPIPPEYRPREEQVIVRRPTAEPSSLVPGPVPGIARRMSGRRRGLVLGVAALVSGAALVAAVAASLGHDGRVGDDGTPASSSTRVSDVSSSRGTGSATGATAMPRNGAPAAATRMPDVVGLPLAQARGALAPIGIELRIERRPSDRPEGVVLEQLPPGGARIASDRPVVVVVSAGLARVAVPEVIGRPVRSAARELRALGFRVDLRSTPSPNAPGSVLRQRPAPGARVVSGSVIRLVVSEREPRPWLEVPALVGMPLADARARLRRVGLRLAVSHVDTDRPKGTVVSQVPEGGAQLRRGQLVRLEVSSGSALVLVPDVVGLDEWTARADLEAVGLEVRIVDVHTMDAADDDLVLAQSPAPGSSVQKGSQVTLRVARLA
jgi:beta-lactam-binding protein with PASTA domain